MGTRLFSGATHARTTKGGGGEFCWNRAGQLFANRDLYANLDFTKHYLCKKDTASACERMWGTIKLAEHVHVLFDACAQLLVYLVRVGEHHILGGVLQNR